jgi:hypothetical protein
MWFRSRRFVRRVGSFVRSIFGQTYRRSSLGRDPCCRQDGLPGRGRVANLTGCWVAICNMIGSASVVRRMTTEAKLEGSSKYDWVSLVALEARRSLRVRAIQRPRMIHDRRMPIILRMAYTTRRRFLANVNGVTDTRKFAHVTACAGLRVNVRLS